MCGRFYIDIDEPELEPYFRADQWVLPGVDAPDESLCSVGEIFPDNAVPVLTLHQGEIRPRLMGWGFPKWDGKGVQFNARSETAHELKSFKESLARWRVVVPTSGFYEWRKEGGQTKKVKYHFTDPAGPVLYLAAIGGIFQQMKSPVKDRFCILTRDSKETIVEEYHHRMPVVLRREELLTWMGPDYRQIIDRAPFELAVRRVGNKT